uniref:Coiled-coil domain containing 28A n=1 Tax=Hucho hucho TaxID=62062 RepID=A0A4W5ME94_9TELE
MTCQLFEERTTLVLHWFDLWTDRQRKLFLQALLSQCSNSQLKDWLMQIVPVTRVDFTSVLPRFLSLYVMSFLTPRDLCSAAQVSWHWRVLAEQDCLWSVRCVRRGWFLPYNPGDREYGGWKSHYVSCVSTLDWLTPREAAQTYGTLNMPCSGEREEEEERRRERRIRQTIRERVEEQKSEDSVNSGGWSTSTSSRPRASPSLSPSPPLLLLLSNRIPAYEVRHLEVGVVVVLYDHRGTLQALLSQAERALGGQRAQRLGVLAPGGTEEITLLQGCKVTERSVLTPDYREFWEKLCGWVVPPEEGGGVDIFCPLAASARGVLLVQSLSTLTELEVSAPTGMATGCFQNILSEWSCSSGDSAGVRGVCASPAQRYVCEGVLQGWSWQTQWLEEALGALRDHLGPQLPRLSLDTRGRVLGRKHTHPHPHTHPRSVSNLCEGGRQLITTQDAALLKCPSDDITASLRMYEHVSDVGLFLFNDAMVLTERNVCHRPFTHTHCDTHTFLASVALHSLTLREITDTRCEYRHTHIQYQSKVWTHLLIECFFFILTIFYIVE